MKKLTLVFLCSLVFLVSWKSENTGALNAESSAADDDDDQNESSGIFLPDCLESGSGEEVQSGDSSSQSSCESGESSESDDASGHHEKGWKSIETLHALSDGLDFSDLIFLEDLETPSGSESRPAINEEIEMSGHKTSSGVFDDDEDF